MRAAGYTAVGEFHYLGFGGGEGLLEAEIVELADRGIAGGEFHYLGFAAGPVQAEIVELAAGYTAVGEFHYLGFEQALAAAEAAEAAGVTSSSSTSPMRGAGSTVSVKPLRTST